MKERFKIPESWKWVTLDDIGIVVSGGTPSTKEPEFWGDEIPWITPSDLSKHKEVYISKGRRSISKVGLDYSSAKLLPKNSVLFSSRAPIGYVVIAKNELATNQGFKNLILTNSINSRYVYYYLSTIKEFAEKMASGTTFLELSATKFKQIPFPLAPIEEQNRIVNKIEELYSEIESNLNKLYVNRVKIQSLKYSILKKIFLDYHTSKLTINDLFNCIDGDRGKNYPKKNDFSAKGYCLFLNTKNVLNGEFKFDKLQFITKEKNELLGNGELLENDIIITTRGTIGNTAHYDAKISKKFQKVRINSSMLILRLKKEFDNYYVKCFLWYFLSPNFIEEIRKKTTGSAQPQLPSNILKTVIVEFPIEVKDQIKMVKDLNEKYEISNQMIEDNEAIINSTILLKSKILQEAFQGKLLTHLGVKTSVNKLLVQIKKEKEEYIKEKSNKDYIKIKRMEKERLTLLEVLKKETSPILAKQLWKNSIYSDDIELFYSELKKIEADIVQYKTEEEVLISLK